MCCVHLANWLRADRWTGVVVVYLPKWGCTSLTIDMNYTGSHACCPHTRNTVVTVDLINLNSELCRSDAGNEHLD